MRRGDGWRVQEINLDALELVQVGIVPEDAQLGGGGGHDLVRRLHVRLLLDEVLVNAGDDAQFSLAWAEIHVLEGDAPSAPDHPDPLALPHDVHEVVPGVALALHDPPQPRDLDQAAEFLIILNQDPELNILKVLGVVFAPAARGLHNFDPAFATFADMMLTVGVLRCVRLHQQALANCTRKRIPQNW